MRMTMPGQNARNGGDDRLLEAPEDLGELLLKAGFHVY